MWSVHVHTCVSLFANVSPISADAPDLPNSFNCSYSHSSATMPLTIFFTRTLDMSLTTSPLGSIPTNSPSSSPSAPSSSSSSSSGPHPPMSSPSRNKVARTLTPSEAVGSGYPLTVRMHVPLWVINSTAMPIRVAVAVKQDEPDDSGSSMFAELSSASGFLGLGSAGSQSGGFQRLGGGEGSSLASGGTGASPLHMVDTEAFKSTFRPRRFVCVAPNSVELISYNMRSELAHVLQLSIMDSKWTAPVPLPALDALTGGRLAAAAAQGRGKKAPTPGSVESSGPSSSSAAASTFNSLEPWVIRSSQSGPSGPRPGMALDPALHETVARLDLGSGIGGLHHLVLRLEPHLVVSNRTGYLLGMLQPDGLGVSLGPLATGISGSTAVAAGGFSPFSSLQSTLFSMKSGTLLGGASRAGSMSSPSRTGSERSDGAQQAPATSALKPSSGPWLQLPPGSVGLPVIWTRGSSQVNGRKMLSLCIPAMVGLVVSPTGSATAVPAATHSQLLPLWSEPFSAEYPGGTHLQVVVPLYCLGRPGSYSHGPDNQQQQPQQQWQQLRSVSISMAHSSREMQPDLAARSTPNWQSPRTEAHMHGGDTFPQTQGASYEEALAGVRAHLIKTCGGGTGFMDSMIDLGSETSEEVQQPGTYSHAPTLFKISRHTEKAGIVDFLAVVIEVSLTLRSPGCLHLQLLSLGSEPAQLLLNATPAALRYREAGYTGAVWSVLPAYSALGYALQHYPKSSLPEPLEIEIRSCGSDDSRGVEVSLGGVLAGGIVGGGGGRGRGGRPRNPAPPRANLTLGNLECLAQVSEVLQLVMSPVGLTLISGSTSGASLGSSRLDKTLRVVPHPPAIGPTGTSATAASIAASSAFASDMLLANSTGAGSSAGAVAGVQSIRISLAVSGLELSIIDYCHSSFSDRVGDHTPQELVVLSLTDLSVEYEAGVTAGVSWVQFHAQVRSAQMDDQLPGSIHPVMMRLQQPDDNNGSGGFGTRLDANRDPRVDPPMLLVTYVSQPNKQRGVLHCPCIAMRTSPLRVAVSEPIVWRLMQLMTMLQGRAEIVGQMDGTAPASREQVRATGQALN